MNDLFTHAPLFVPGMDKRDWIPGSDLERRVEEVEAKQGTERRSSQIVFGAS